MSATPPPTPTGPTGEVCPDLPSPYLAHGPTGLLHLPRFIAKIRKHLAGQLPESYRRNFTKGFDGFLCLQFGVEPARVIELVEKHGHDTLALDRELVGLFPPDHRAPQWNRELTQRGLSAMGQERLGEIKRDMGIGHREDLKTFADVIEFDEGRLP